MNDWTTSENGHSNMSFLFLEGVAIISGILRNIRLNDNLDRKARYIMAQLAHVMHLGPRDEITAAERRVVEAAVEWADATPLDFPPRNNKLEDAVAALLALREKKA